MWLAFSIPWWVRWLLGPALLAGDILDALRRK